jgi:hypothetical protein
MTRAKPPQHASPLVSSTSSPLHVYASSFAPPPAYTLRGSRSSICRAPAPLTGWTHTHTHTHTHTTVRDNCLDLRHTTRVSLRPGRSCDTSLPQQYSPHWGLNPGPSVYRTDALPLSYRGTGTIDIGTMTEMLHYRRIFTSRRRRPCSSRAVSNRGNHTSSVTWAACCGRLRRP